MDEAVTTVSSAEFVGVEIDRTDFPPQARGVLNKIRARTYGDLSKWSEPGLARVKGAGPFVIHLFREHLTSRGLSFAADMPGDVLVDAAHAQGVAPVGESAEQPPTTPDFLEPVAHTCHPEIARLSVQQAQYLAGTMLTLLIFGRDCRLNINPQFREMLNRTVAEHHPKYVRSSLSKAVLGEIGGVSAVRQLPLGDRRRAQEFCWVTDILETMLSKAWSNGRAADNATDDHRPAS